MATDGCWVQFYDGEKKSGGTKRFDGPLDVADLNDYTFSTGEKGGDETDSLVLGSRAWIQVFKDDDYGGKTAYFYPNQTIEDLDAYGMGGTIDSFKLYDYQPASFPAPTTVTWAVEDNDGVVSASTINNFFRTALGSALMLVPVVGAALKTMVYGLWPDPRTNKEQAWASFQNYISQVVGTVYDQLIDKELTIKLQGLYNVMRNYVESTESERAGNFTALINTLDFLEPSFLDVEDPQKTLKFSLPFGSIMLLTMREEILFHEEIFGDRLSPDERAKRVRRLQEKIDVYQAAIAAARAELLALRATMIKLQDNSSITVDKWTPYDTYSGWRGVEEYSGGAKRRAEYAAAKHTEVVTNELAWQIDQNTAQTQLWSWTNPDNLTPIRAPEVVFVEGPYGDFQESTRFSAVADDGKRITQVRVRAGDLIDSLEVFIDGTSTGVQGRTGDTNAAPFEVALATGQSIINSKGRSSTLINALGFTADNGQSFLAGSPGNSGFDSHAPEGTADGRLVGLSGYSLNGTTTGCNLKVLTFHWYCTLPLPEKPVLPN
ncbi:hypothetical protein [Acidovorax sp. NCPPB 3576]|uniref:hypothetical protein n=1 Tax=Acidovorax sp. NCPPB 3576 TaxID=2940488 RepID=UPI00234A54F7|nr:hypothetical protein [Acidovorax sp. NCPPB 3576]WCM90092.1 hypothetical protein M5C98_08805 [Acidovorax sp. NCPPB 3576]